MQKSKGGGMTVSGVCSEFYNAPLVCSHLLKFSYICFLHAQTPLYIPSRSLIHLSVVNVHHASFPFFYCDFYENEGLYVVICGCLEG